MSEQDFKRLVLGRRELVQSVFAASSLAFLSACGSLAPASGTSAGEGSSGAFKIGISAPSCIDPYNAVDYASLSVVSQMFCPLTSFDPASSSVETRAAASYSMNDDATEFTFKIRRARFHNGEDVDSHAFKRAWERMIDPKSAVVSAHGASSVAWLLALVEGYDELASGSVSGLSGVTCPDANTLAVKLAEPYAEFPIIVSHPALSPVPQAAIDDPVTFYEHPQGNGPYRLKGTFSSGKGLTLTRFKSYFEGSPSVSLLKFAVESASDGAYKEFQAGELDVCEVPIEQVRAAQSSRGVSEDGRVIEDGRRLAASPTLSTIYLACNTDRTFLKEQDVRRAISLAIDRSDLAKNLFRGVYTAASGIVPAGCEAAREEAWEYCTTDATRAGELLDGAHPLTDGARDVELKILASKTGFYEKLAEAIAGDLEVVGLSVSVEALDESEYASRRASGDYDLLLVRSEAAVPAADLMLYPLFASASIGAHNYARYSSSAFDKKIGEARSATDPSSRASLYREAEDIVADDVPVVPLLHPARLVAASDRVERMTVSFDGVVLMADAELAEGDN